MRGHQLLDTVKQLSGKKQELPSQRCERHGGKLIDVYCPGHDKVGCSTCMTIDHSGCKGISYIPDLACKTKTSEKLNLLGADLNTLQSRFHVLKQNKQEELENAKKDKIQLIKDIKTEKKKINDHLDKMEMELLQEVDATFQIKLQHIKFCMKEVDANIALLQENMQQISAAKHENESEKYVQIKLVNERRKGLSDFLEDLGRSRKTGRLRLEPNGYVTDSKCNFIGNVLHLPVIEIEKCHVNNMKTNVDRESCLLHDMCMSEDGCIVMTDYNNKCIKKMNDSFQIISPLKVTDNPFGICQIDSSMLAVTLINDKTVQFISQTEPMKLQQSFKVGDRCRGIAYNDGMIYVCCGGSKRKNEDVGHLEVYTTSGKLLASYIDMIQYPTHVKISSLTREIFVTDVYEGILVVDKTRSMKPITINKQLFSNPSCIYEINKSQLCVGFYKSNNVLLMSTDGKDQVELLTEDGLTKPTALCFDNKTSRLFVFCEGSDTLTVFSSKKSH